MPWTEASPMDQRTQFTADHLRDWGSITELCALYSVSRKTGYKWIGHYLRLGPPGLDERSRRPRRASNQTPGVIVAAILDTRRRHPSWGGKKLLALLHKRHPQWSLSGRSLHRVRHPAPPWNARASAVGGVHVSQPPADLDRAHLRRAALVMEQDEAADPPDVGLLAAARESCPSPPPAVASRSGCPSPTSSASRDASRRSISRATASPRCRCRRPAASSPS